MEMPEEETKEENKSDDNGEKEVDAALRAQSNPYVTLEGAGEKKDDDDEMPRTESEADASLKNPY